MTSPDQPSRRGRLPWSADQAGLFVQVDGETWIKTGLERSDGLFQLGAVVTFGQSDWSVAPVDGWAGRKVTVRVSRTADALIVRAGQHAPFEGGPARPKDQHAG